jgi:hypothetical protein
MRLRNAESRNDEVSQNLISLRSSSYHHTVRTGEGKNNRTNIQNYADFMNNSMLTLPSIYNYMSHLLGSKNSLVPTYHLSAGRHGGMMLCHVLQVMKSHNNFAN